MYFKQIFDRKLAQYAYIIGCQESGEAIVIDPMRDVDQYFQNAASENLKIIAAADTHIHADYVSGLREMAERDVKVYASDEGGADWKYEWLAGSGYDHKLITGGDSFRLGNIRFDVVATPGHTPESISFLVTDGAAADRPMGVLTGDFVFVGDVGRPDLLETAAGESGAMKPSAQQLYGSVQQFKQLPEYLQVWPGHGSGSACGKALGAVPESTVGYELRFNPAFRASGSENEFVRYILDGQPEPPLYFGRMKVVNREGPAVLGDLPKPERMTPDRIVQAEGTVIDTRDKHTFMRGHLEGSLFAPIDNNNFNTVAGSYAEADSEIFLVIEKERLEEAVRDLVRVGLDRIAGYVTPDDLESWEGDLKQIRGINFDEMKQMREERQLPVLDVRKASEYDEGHLPGAINIAHTRLADQLDRLPRDKPLLVHCRSGQRASYATALLAREGFRVLWVDDLFDRLEPGDVERGGI